MGIVKVAGFAVSLDGFGAGPEQDLANPLSIGCGVSTIRQYLKARLIDEPHLVSAPVFLGSGENLFSGLDMPALGYHPVERIASDSATHIIIQKESRK